MFTTTEVKLPQMSKAGVPVAMSRFPFCSRTTVAVSLVSRTLRAAESRYRPSAMSSVTFRPMTSRRRTEKARSKAALTRITTPWLSVTKMPS